MIVIFILCMNQFQSVKFLNIFRIRNEYIVYIFGSNNGQFYNNRPYPRYSLEKMPETQFSCRDKILGGYYADRETQCQMFHICVKVPGVGVQNYRFLCPNGTAFDQDNQICADWDDVDCEAETLYYSSDNFDLYRIGSGFETKPAPSSVNEDEETFHLQKSETGDLRLNREHQITRVNQQQHHYSREQDILRGSSSSNYFNNKNNGKEDEYDDQAKKPQYYKNFNEIRKTNLKKTITTTTKRPEFYTYSTTRTPVPISSTITTTTTAPTTPFTTSARSTLTTKFLTEDQFTTAINNYRSRQLYSARKKIETLKPVSPTLPNLTPTTLSTTQQHYYKKTNIRAKPQQKFRNRFIENPRTEVPIEKTDSTKTFFKKYSDPNTFKNLQFYNRKLESSNIPITTYRASSYKLSTLNDQPESTTFYPQQLVQDHQLENEESLKTAHSTNFASSKNQLTLSSKFNVGFNIEDKKASFISEKKDLSPSTTIIAATAPPITTSRRNYYQDVIKNAKLTTTTHKYEKKYESLAKSVDKANVNADLEKNRDIDASYDYAYYDSGNNHEDEYIGDLEFNKSVPKIKT